MTAPKLIRACAVCDGREKQVLYRQPLELPKDRCNYSGYEVVACTRCGFVYADGTTAQITLDDHYRGLSKAAQDLAAVGEPECDIIRLEATAEYLKPIVQRGWRLLDVGCGSGKLLSMLRDSCGAEVEGVDQSPVAAARGAKSGVKIHTASIFDFECGEYELVITSHVLEHLVDLSGFLHRLYSATAPGGLLYVEVPDAADCRRHLDPHSTEPWIFGRELYTHFTPEHVNFFSARSLRNLMLRHGFVEGANQTTPLGAIASLWKRRPTEIDTETREEIAAYAQASRALQESALRVIREVADSGREILVWGAGLHTQRLMASGGLGQANIRAIIDRDPIFQGTTMAGRPIIAPDAIPPGIPIVISSYKAEGAIAAAARKMGLDNQLILLYS